VDIAEALRQLPSVDEVLLTITARWPEIPRGVLVGEIRASLEEYRGLIRAGQPVEMKRLEAGIEGRLRALCTPSLRRVINATGVVLHTNLGRAPLPPFTPVPGYSNLEFDLATGKRGRRDVHVLGLIERLFGHTGIVVNNNAAAVYLALHELAAGYEVIVSRGELIEIGDGFRIPEIMQRSGAILREVGTTNRTRIEDYRNAVNDRTRLILRVHPSNFRISGFTARPELSELASLGKERGIPVYEDLGSGCAVDLRAWGVDEPSVQASLEQGVDLVSFSGDKLLGGAQAGFLVGNTRLVSRLRSNPMFRALRVDKLICQALETTLRALLLEEWDRLPALWMIRQTADRIRERALALAGKLAPLPVEVVPGQSVIGGGSTPEQALPTWLLSLKPPDVVAAERALRQMDPPVVARIERDRLLLDLRTVFPEEEPLLAAALQALSW